MVMFTFYVLDQKFHFWGNLVKKLIIVFQIDVHFLYFRLKIPSRGIFGTNNQDCLFKLKFGTKSNSNVLNSSVMFTFLS